MKKKEENISKNPLEAESFSRMFDAWGKNDAKRRSTNSWHNPEIAQPAEYSYQGLTAGLHMDEAAYRRWLLTIVAHLVFGHASSRQCVRLLELGCADGTDLISFLETYGPYWGRGKSKLEIHLLDDDKKMLKEAAQRIGPKIIPQIKVSLWQGRIEDLGSAEHHHFEHVFGSGDKDLVFPSQFEVVFSQLVLHHYSLYELLNIFRDIEDILSPAGYFVLSDIAYMGVRNYDALIWNRVLRQIEGMKEPDRKAFWLSHYEADCPTYHNRKEIISALEITGFKDVELLQCFYDMITLVGKKSRKI